MLGVAPVARALRHDHLARAQAAKGLDRGRDHGRVGIDHARRVELDEVRLQDDLASHDGRRKWRMPWRTTSVNGTE